MTNSLMETLMTYVRNHESLKQRNYVSKAAMPSDSPPIDVHAAVTVNRRRNSKNVVVE